MASGVLISSAIPNPGIDPWSVIDAIGRRTFYADMLGFLHELCGADHCAIYRIDDDALSELGTCSYDGSQTCHDRVSRYLRAQGWREDPAIFAAKQVLDEPRPSLVRVDVGALPSGFRRRFYPDIGERVILCGQRGQAGYCLSILRSNRAGPFTAEQVVGLRGVGDSLVSVVAKHAETQSRSPHLALSSLPVIEACLLADGQLSRREAEVCARVLYGLSATGIGLDLGIGGETVKTYRNRAFQRLGIGSPRELLMWYLTIWQRHDGQEAPRLAS